MQKSAQTTGGQKSGCPQRVLKGRPFDVVAKIPARFAVEKPWIAHVLIPLHKNGVSFSDTKAVMQQGRAFRVAVAWRSSCLAPDRQSLIHQAGAPSGRDRAGALRRASRVRPH